MRSKIITTVLAVLIVGPFAYIAAADAVSIKQHLNKQTEQIQQLSTESVELDKKLEQTVQAKEKAQVEALQTEQQTIDAVAERQRLEAELGANL